MIKVKEFLDKNFYNNGDTSATLKSNGHYNVIGYWEYPKDISKLESNRFNEHLKIDPKLKNWVPSDQMSFVCNKERYWKIKNIQDRFCKNKIIHYLY